MIIGIPLSYFGAPFGDRLFAVGVFAVFAIVVTGMLLAMPVLRCPHCGQATDYFDNYSEWFDRLSGRHRRHVMCSHCQTIIDRMDGSAVQQVLQEDGQALSRLFFLVSARMILLFSGWCVVLVVTGFVYAIAWPAFQRNPANPRAVSTLVCCCLTFIAGIAFLVTSWWLRRRAHRFAKSRGIRIEKRIRIRW